MARVSFEPMIKWFTGRIGRLVYRRSHNGKVSVYAAPDMSRVKWSPAQREHRQRMRAAFRYASASVADPEIRPIYVEMAEAYNMNKDRPFDVAVKDYYHTGNDLLWKKHMGDRQKPSNWDMDLYSWYFAEKKRGGKRRAP